MSPRERRRRLTVVGTAVAGALLVTWSVQLWELARQVEGYAAYWSVPRGEPGGLLLVALGDSAAQGIGASSPRHGYVSLLADRLRSETGRPVEVVNLSRSGATTRQVLAEQVPALEALGRTPDLVTVGVGGNDVAWAYDAAALADDVRDLLDALPAARTVVADVPWFMHGRWERDAADAGELLRAEAEERGFALAPLHRMLEARGWRSMVTDYAADWFHPGDRGHRVWAEAFWRGACDGPLATGTLGPVPATCGRTGSAGSRGGSMPAALPRETVEHVVWSAGLAPSVHNTQPWRFTTSDDVLDLHADRRRQLSVLDPDGRQLHLSCGAALEHARVCARALGLDADVALLPDPADPDHLARLVLSPGEPPTAAEAALADAAVRRHTHRSAFAPGHVPEDVLEVLRAAVDREGAGLRAVTDEDDRVALTVLLSHADAEEERDEDYRRELAAWAGIEGSPDEGIPAEVVDATSGQGSSLTLRRFPTAEPPPPGEDPPPAEHADVLVVVTRHDAPRDWLQAGQALGALLLHATLHGLGAQPLGQVTDKDAYRHRLAVALGLAGVPQMALRVGYARSTGPATRRRRVSETLDRSTATP